MINKTIICALTMIISISFISSSYSQNNMTAINNEQFTINVPSNWISDYNKFNYNNTVTDVYRYIGDKDTCSVAVMHIKATTKSQDTLNEEFTAMSSADEKYLTETIFKKFTSHKVISVKTNSQGGLKYKDILVETSMKSGDLVQYGKTNIRMFVRPQYSYTLNCSTFANSQTEANKIFDDNVKLYISIVNSFRPQ